MVATNNIESELEIFGSEPRKKWLDVIFNASQGLARDELLALLNRLAACELLCERNLGEFWERDLEMLLSSEESGEELEKAAQNLAIESMGKILSQNE